MNLQKLFQKKDEEERSVKVQRTEAPKKSAQKPVKARKAETPKKASKKPGESRVALMWQTVRQYLREVVSELRKVVWPSRKETLGTTAVVLVIVAFSGVFLGLVDAVLSRLVRLLIG